MPKPFSSLAIVLPAALAGKVVSVTMAVTPALLDCSAEQAEPEALWESAVVAAPWL